MTMEKTTEPIWWGLFSAGGVVAAFLVSIHIILVGFALPLGWISDSGALYRIWWVKIYIFFFIVFTLYPLCHPHYFTLDHTERKTLSKLLAVLCYGGAIFGTVVTVWVLLKI